MGSGIFFQKTIRRTSVVFIAFAGIACSQAESVTASEILTTIETDQVQSFDYAKAMLAGARPVTADFAVAPQIKASDLQGFADAGFTRIINHRPDGEVMGQPLSANISAEAKRLGIEFVDLPFRSGYVTESAFDGLLEELQRPSQATLSYCRSGTRSITIWAMAQVQLGAMTPDQVISSAQSAGYRLDSQRRLFEQIANTSK